VVIMKIFRVASLLLLIHILILPLFFSAAFCRQNTERNNVQPLGYEMITIEKSYSKGKSIEEFPSYCRLRYPHFYGGKSANAINNIIESWIADSTSIRLDDDRSGRKSVEKLAEEFLHKYDTFRKESRTRMPYQFDLTGAVLLNRAGLLTLDLSFYSYTGGAHGMNHTGYMVLDSGSGRRLWLKDLFFPGYERRLNELVDARFRQIKGLSKSDRLDEEEGGLVENSIHYNNNFAVTDKGVLFFYNVYEIAPYINGPTELKLAWRELKDVLTPRFKTF
jgi:hypothetical protein